jgi:dTDP-4-amino-4,6-dideoxygalactose transaminase
LTKAGHVVEGPEAAGAASQIPVFDVRLRDRDVEAVAECLRSGWLTMGPRTQAFEAAFAEQLGVPHAVAVSSCTAALHLAYRAAGVGPGDEVVVPAMTFVATAAAVRHCGATPVIADIAGTHDFGIDPEDVARRITSRTKAVCAVHYGGYAAAIGPLRRLCADRGLALFEDAAHAPSATAPGLDGKLGTLALAGAFSFFSNKILTCGEGGLLATHDPDVAAYARRARSHAMTSGTWDRHRGHAAGYDVVEVGFNYRLDEPRAALLNARLGLLEDDIARRRRLVRRYRTLLGDRDGVSLPYQDADVEHSSCYLMAVLVDAQRRDDVRARMREAGVQTSIVYPALHELTAYLDGAARLARAEEVARRQITLPLYPHLTDAQQDRVVDALLEAIDALPLAAQRSC